ncbi:MAG: CbiX/SirB N-terminal domain-containing protein [Coriobacteriia bacterium]|nr:CbiX/SirB N-terminal domain-containing protein [Coriobacteriia bacterium]
MKGTLVIAHGSRAKETEATMDSILAMVKAELPDTIIEQAYMEFSEQNVQKGVAALAERGVTEIKVVPYFLFMGIHLKQDIPEMVEECLAKYPGVSITMGENLGADKRLAEILADRIRD